MNLYLALAAVTVTLHVSIKQPTLKHPEEYGLNGCSGVFVGPNEVLTAAHCVKNSRGRQWIKTDEGKSYAVSIDKIDIKRDLALLKVNKNIRHEYARIGPPIGITQMVYTVNSGEGIERTYNQGVVNNVFLDQDEIVLSVLHNAAILQGASGSGLFNSRGQLIGINVAIVKDLYEAVDVLEINAFLNRR